MKTVGVDIHEELKSASIKEKQSVRVEDRGL